MLSALALVMLAGGPVDAKTLRTLAARVDSDQSVRVLVTNLDTKPMEDFTVTLTNFSGTVTMPNANFCAEDAPLPPQNTCQVDYSSGQGGFATVTGKGKFSASLHLLGPDDGDTVIILPATK